MEDDFDVNAAVDEIGGGLGLDLPEATGDDLTLEVEAKVVPEAKELPAPETPSETPGETPAETPTTPAATNPDSPPLTWRKEASAVWATIPSEAKAEILKRENDIFKGIEAYKVDAGFGKTMKSVVAPYEHIMRANGMAPEVAVTNMLSAHHTLGTGTPEQKLAMLQSIAKSYRVDLTQLAAPAGEPPYIDPTVAALQNELREVKSFVSEAQQRQRQAVVTTVSAEVDSFASDPANVHFSEVANNVATLIERGIATSLKDAYEQAVWANPVTRAKEIARTSAEASAKAAADAAARVTAARKASSANVQTRAKSGSATTPTGSLDDTLSEALADIRARA